MLGSLSAMTSRTEQHLISLHFSTVCTEGLVDVQVQGHGVYTGCLAVRFGHLLTMEYLIVDRACAGGGVMPMGKHVRGELLRGRHLGRRDYVQILYFTI